MAGPTSIEWAEQSWNPIVGCSITSPGCTNCYAMKMAHRLQAMADKPRWTKKGVGTSHYVGTTKVVNGKAVWTGKLALAPEHVLLAPLRRKKPTTYFVNSMGDLFHEDCPDEWIDRVFAIMALAPQHTFQVLTKRAARMRAYFLAQRQGKISLAHDTMGIPFFEWPLPNCWLGVSAEDQKRADERIPHLLATPAAVRFLSVEPLLGLIDLHRVREDTGFTFDALSRKRGISFRGVGLDQVIAGDESGPNRRTCNLDWVRALRDQCVAAGTPFFLKQLHLDGRKVSLPVLDGRQHNGMPTGFLGRSAALTEGEGA